MTRAWRQVVVAYAMLAAWLPPSGLFVWWAKTLRFLPRFWWEKTLFVIGVICAVSLAVAATLFVSRAGDEFLRSE